MGQAVLSGDNTLVCMYSQVIGRIQTLNLKTDIEDPIWLAEFIQFDKESMQSKSFVFPIRDIHRDNNYLTVELYMDRDTDLPKGLNVDLVKVDRRIAVTLNRIEGFKISIATCDIENKNLKDIQIAAYESILNDLRKEVNELYVERDRFLNVNNASSNL